MTNPVKIWRNQKKIKELLGLKGKIVSFTKVFVPPSGFESLAPYVVAIVKLDRGKNYTAQLIDWDTKHLKVGQVVRTVLRRVRKPGSESVIPYGIKFKPIG